MISSRLLVLGLRASVVSLSTTADAATATVVRKEGFCFMDSF